MARYHLNLETGSPGLCRAKEGNCPYESISEHYATREEAAHSYEDYRQAILLENIEKITDYDVANQLMSRLYTQGLMVMAHIVDLEAEVKRDQPEEDRQQLEIILGERREEWPHLQKSTIYLRARLSRLGWEKSDNSVQH